MSLLGRIAATYRGPRAAMRGLLEGPVREDRALALVMGFAVLAFVAQWPGLARQAQESGENLQMLLGGSLMGIVFILPLILYVFAGLSHLLMRLFGGHGSGYRARMALFWALVAALPLQLIYGLLGGVTGDGTARDLVGLAWLAVFLWFWTGGLFVAELDGGRGPKRGVDGSSGKSMDEA